MNRVGIGVIIMLTLLCIWIFIPGPKDDPSKQKQQQASSPVLEATQSQSVPQRRVASQQVVQLRAGTRSEVHDIPQGWTFGFKLVRDKSCVMIYPNQGAGVTYCKGTAVGLGQSVSSLEFLSVTTDERLQVNICPPEDRLPCE